MVITMPSGAVPLEPAQSFNHDGVVARVQQQPQQRPQPQPQPGDPVQMSFNGRPSTKFVPAPAPAVIMNPALQQGAELTLQPMVAQMQTPAPYQEPVILGAEVTTTTPAASVASEASQIEVSALRAQTGDYFINDEIWDLAKRISSSLFVPAVIRSTPDKDRTADVYLLLSKAASIGLSAADAFTELFIIYTESTRTARIGMYVKTKAALCAKHGHWDVQLDMATGVVTVTGKRYDNGQERTLQYTPYEASLRGVLKLDTNGNIMGVGKWADKWPDMMRTRALGRFLDALFPDIIRGIETKEDFDDEAYIAELERGKKASRRSKGNEFDIAAASSSIRRGKKAVDAVEPVAPSESAERSESAESAESSASGNGVQVEEMPAAPAVMPATTNPFADAESSAQSAN